MSGRSRLAGRPGLMARGLVYLTAFAMLVGLVVAQYSGAFTDRVTVQAALAQTGDSLVSGSDVKMRGVIVGRVGEIARRTGAPGALVELHLEPAAAGRIPAAVTARSLPANFFGQTFVDLVAPAAATGAPTIRAGAVIPQDTSAETVELQDVFGKLYRVLTAVQPAKLATALGALAEALDGNGARVNELIGRTDAYLRALRPHLPTLQADITAFATFAETLRDQAPALLDSVDDVLVLARTLVEQEARFIQLLSGGLGLSRNAREFLTGNEDNAVRVARQSRQVIGTFARHPKAFSDGFLDLGAFLGGIATTGEGKVDLDSELNGAELPSYSSADCPRYPGLDGPNCATAGPEVDDAVALETAAAGRVAATRYGGIGRIGSVADTVSMAQVLGVFDGQGGRTFGDAGMLLAGPVLRGQTVLLPEAAS